MIASCGKGGSYGEPQKDCNSHGVGVLFRNTLLPWGRGVGIGISLGGFLMLLSHRTLPGFVIGISSLRWHWTLYGILLGLIVGIPDVHFFNMVRGELSNGLCFLFGAVRGLMIEFFTSVVFKAKVVHS
jgi:hypothetical protein